MRQIMRTPRRLLLAIFVTLAIAACQGGPTVEILAPNGSARASVRVEIVDTPESRETGLMHRNHLDEMAGMLFVFRSSGALKFWMKNTEIPLDMIFADANRRIIGIVVNAVPYSERPVGPDAASEYVLEVNGGFSARRGVKVGDRLEFRGFTPLALN